MQRIKAQGILFYPGSFGLLLKSTRQTLLSCVIHFQLKTVVACRFLINKTKFALFTLVESQNPSIAIFESRACDLIVIQSTMSDAESDQDPTKCLQQKVLGTRTRCRDRDRVYTRHSYSPYFQRIENRFPKNLSILLTLISNDHKLRGIQVWFYQTDLSQKLQLSLRLSSESKVIIMIKEIDTTEGRSTMNMFETVRILSNSIKIWCLYDKDKKM